MTFVELILKRCSAIKNNRTRSSVLKSVMMEVGELAQEVAIEDGESYKKPGTDGIIGESIDVILSAIDQIYIENPTISEKELMDIALPKLDKWENSVKEIPMDVTCAIVIKYGDTLLLAHSTNSPWNEWNFPKGIADPGESHIDAAIRELDEETGLKVTADKLIDLGHFPYLPEKEIHLYLFESPTDIDAKKLVCESMFYCDRKMTHRPECDSFRMVSFDKLAAYLAPKIAQLYYSELRTLIEG